LRFLLKIIFYPIILDNEIEYIETGKRTPNLYSLLSICKALQINPAALFEPDEIGHKEAHETIIRLVSQFM
jgi:transcriptional regulator with XRE-family HTH domain